ncbi:MAG: hypothetical protein ACJA1F_003351 [Paracoccaceae bacterium]|jgi:hypothetical protein
MTSRPVAEVKKARANGRKGCTGRLARACRRSDAL